MSIFAGLKEKLADKLAEFKASTTPQDPLEKQACELVDKTTSDGLIAPDWTLNLAVVDFLNSDVRSHGGRIAKAIRRSLLKHNTKVQLLSLTLLETCVKNSTEDFHSQLAASELWDDIVKLAGDTSITRVDGEVRDKMLGMVEDFARGLKPAQYQAAYESLLDRGVDFPVRGAENAVPILTPPAPAAAQAAAVGVPPVPTAAGVPAGGVAPAAAAGGDADPLAGVDEQDRAAIQAALAELEAEAQAAQEAARIAAEADAEERRLQRLQLEEQQQQQQLQQQADLLAAQEQQRAQQAEAEAVALASLVQASESAAAAAAAAATATATAGPQPAGGFPGATAGTHPAVLADGDLTGAEQDQQPQEEESAGTPEERMATVLETASNTTLLLSEMLASVPETEPVAVREPYVSEVAYTCLRLRARLEKGLETLTDEALMASALSQHDELTRVLSRYDELLAAAEAVAPSAPRHAAAVAVAGAHPGVAQAQAYGYGQGHGHVPPAPPGPTAGTAAEPVGHRVAQTAAGFAAAFKEKFTGAFDKLVAVASRGPAPPTSTPGAAGGYMPPGYAAAGVAAGDPGVVGGTVPTSNTFTLDDDEEAHEGTSLITRRAPAAQNQEPQWVAQQAVALSPPPPPPPPPPPQQQLQQPHDDHLAGLVHQATNPTPAPVAMAAPVQQPACPDLIDLGEESAQAAAVPARADATSGNLLSGLDVHHPKAAGPPPPLQPLPEDAPAAIGVPEGSAPGAPPAVAGHSRGPSHADQLVEALDRLVSQASVGTSSPGANLSGTNSTDVAQH